MSTHVSVAGHEVAVITNCGRVRPLNEDVVAVDRRIFSDDMESPVLLRAAHTGQLVLLVADGMGGHAKGELASRSVVEFLVADEGLRGAVEGCARAVIAANDHIYDVMQQTPSSAGMGTTIAGVVVSENSLVWFNVGDSRVYRFQPPQLQRLSQDDVPPWQGSGPRISHALTQSLGGLSSRCPIDPHVGVCPPLEERHVVLLCSDGLSDMVSDAEIAEALHSAPGVLDVVQSLFHRAMQAGGVDNVSIVVARRTGHSHARC